MEALASAGVSHRNWKESWSAEKAGGGSCVSFEKGTTDENVFCAFCARGKNQTGSHVPCQFHILCYLRFKEPKFGAQGEQHMFA